MTALNPLEIFRKHTGRGKTTRWGPGGVIEVSASTPGDDPQIPYSPEQNIGRRKYLQDLAELRELRETGGPAAEESRAFQRSAAAKQIAMARGLNQGGRGLRMGTEAAGQSYVESEASVAMIVEAAKQGYTEQEANAAGLLAADDVLFDRVLEQAVAEYRRAMREADPGSSILGTLGQATAMATKLGFA